MRLPNGFGSIVALKGNRRNPYAAYTKTEGYTDEGHPIRRVLGYFETYEEAYAYLLEYNKNPYEVDCSKVTYKEVYELLLKRRKESPEGIKISLERKFKMAFDNTKELHDIPMANIKTLHLQALMDELTHKLKKCSLMAIKSIWHQMWEFGDEYDITKKNYASFVKVNKEDDEEHHEPFSRAQIDYMWEQVDKISGVDMVLVMCYCGYRASAFEGLKVNLDEMYFQGGIKTKAGKNRIVPIHSRIYPLVQKLLYEGQLFGQEYHQIQRKFHEVMSDLGISEKSMHCCRSAFASQLEFAGAKDLHIKRMMGHASGDLTKDVYTKVEIEELRKSLELVP